MAAESWLTLHCTPTAQSSSGPEVEAGTPSPWKNHHLPPRSPSVDRATEPSSCLFCLHRFTFHSGAKRKQEHKGGQSHELPLVHRCNTHRMFSSPGASAPSWSGHPSPIGSARRQDPKVGCPHARLCSFSSAAIITRAHSGRSQPGSAVQ